MDGPSTLRLQRVSFVPYDDADSPAFGFLDPGAVLRGCHLLQGFAAGTTTTYLGRSRARDTPSGDWIQYYINRYACSDRCNLVDTDSCH